VGGRAYWNSDVLRLPATSSRVRLQTPKSAPYHSSIPYRGLNQGSRACARRTTFAPLHFSCCPERPGPDNCREMRVLSEPAPRSDSASRRENLGLIARHSLLPPRDPFDRTIDVTCPITSRRPSYVSTSCNCRNIYHQMTPCYVTQSSVKWRQTPTDMTVGRRARHNG